MAKDSRSSSSTIWRTVVFAGAMLGTPTLVAAQGAPPPPSKNAPPSKAAESKPAPVAPKPDPATLKAEQIKKLDGERDALLAKLVETEPKELDKLRREIVAKDSAIKKLVDEVVNLRKPRPRTPVVRKPVGRGFVLA